MSPVHVSSTSHTVLHGPVLGGSTKLVELQHSGELLLDPIDLLSILGRVEI